MKERLEELQELLRTKNALQKQVVNFRDLWKNLNTAGVVPSTCRCGREFNCLRALHCPSCGSIAHLAVRKLNEFRNWETDDNKVIKVLAIGYRCVRCSLAYTDLDTFQNCEAPPLQPTMKEVRSTEKAKTKLKEAGINNTNDFIRQLEEFRASRDKE